MYSFSKNTTSYSGNRAAMLGWKFDSERQWYQTSVFWDINDQRWPQDPPQYLIRNFVPGRKRPHSALKISFRKGDPTAISNQISDGEFGASSEDSTLTESFHSIVLYSDSTCSDKTPQGSALSGSTYFLCLPQPDGDDMKTRNKQPMPRSRSFLPRLKLTTPEGKESECIVLQRDQCIEFKSCLKTAWLAAEGGQKGDTEDAGDIWNFDEWEEVVDKLVDARVGQRTITSGR